MQLDLELYRESVEVEPNVRISFIDVAPERPSQTILFHSWLWRRVGAVAQPDGAVCR